MNHFLQNYNRDRWQQGVKIFLQKSWYKLTILILVAIIFTYKDLSIHFDLSSPFSKSQSATPPSIEDKFKMPNKPKPTPKQQFTDKLKKDSRVESFSLFPAFLFGSERTPKTLESALAKTNKKTITRYVKSYSHVAVEEMNKYGIPASITLGQALLHGQAGTSELSKNSNNHFSITCGSRWKEATIDIEGMCYRKYDGVWKSYRDHSLLLTKGRFKSLKRFSSTDYKQWAKGLEKNGYSMVKGYGNLLIKTIKQYNLDKYDA